MTDPASRPARRRAPAQADLRAALWYAHSVLIALALLSGSWRWAPEVELGLFAPVRPVAALDTLALNAAWRSDASMPAGPISGAAAVEFVSAQRAAARPATPAPTRSIRLSDALRQVLPGTGQRLTIDAETLWLARCIYSESDRPHEQELVAWVVRNRVATGHRGQRTYRDVVLDPKQFSAFNAGAPKRAFYSSLEAGDRAPGWRRALLIASYVRRAPWTQRPFEINVQHFYSEVSMVGRRHPTWAAGKTPVRPNRAFELDPYRFRFLALNRTV